MTVEGAIKELRRQQSMMGVPASAEAIQMAISALEKEKEPALQEAKTSSNNNYSIKNDNTKSKECQEVIDRQIEELLDYFNGQLSDEEQKAFNKGQRFRELVFVQESLKEKINETEKDN